MLLEGPLDFEALAGGAAVAPAGGPAGAVVLAAVTGVLLSCDRLCNQSGPNFINLSFRLSPMLVFEMINGDFKD